MSRNIKIDTFFSRFSNISLILSLLSKFTFCRNFKSSIKCLFMVISLSIRDILEKEKRHFIESDRKYFNSDDIYYSMVYLLLIFKCYLISLKLQINKIIAWDKHCSINILNTCKIDHPVVTC